MTAPHLRGMSLIDVVVGIALMLVLFLALFGVLRTSLTLSTQAKAEAAAVELANTQMEYLRGLSYDALGTLGGIPAGLIPQMATTTVDGMSYGVRTFIENYDDPVDSLGVSGTDGNTTDYKIGKVTVTYSIGGLSKSVSLISNFAPPGIETNLGGGTLAIHVVNTVGADVSDASVQIVNTSLSPTVDFTTFTNTSGLAVIGGAATSSSYQVYVSKPGYSSAQTYARTSQNVNPTPGFLTVVTSQTTTATFAIDLLASLTLSTYSPATTTAFVDSFADTSNLAGEKNTQVSGGALTLSNGALSGSAQSVAISPSYLDGWDILSATSSTPSGTDVAVQVLDASGTPLPDTVLAGNSSGFTSFPISLVGISTSTYPTLALEATLTSNSASTTPSLLGWSLSHTQGPEPLPNAPFTLTGTKTIGTSASTSPIYKTVLTDTTNSSGSKTESLEWDAYTLSNTNMPVIESCPNGPYQLQPSEATSTTLLLGVATTNTLLVAVQGEAGSPIGNAKVVLATPGYAASVPTSTCGLAYFEGLAAGTYAVTVSASGYTTTTLSAVAVSGHTATTTITLP